MRRVYFHTKKSLLGDSWSETINKAKISIYLNRLTQIYNNSIQYSNPSFPDQGPFRTCFLYSRFQDQPSNFHIRKHLMLLILFHFLVQFSKIRPASYGFFINLFCIAIKKILHLNSNPHSLMALFPSKN